MQTELMFSAVLRAACAPGNSISRKARTGRDLHPWEPRSEPREPFTAQVKVVSHHQAGVGGTSVSLRGTS